MFPPPSIQHTHQHAPSSPPSPMNPSVENAVAEGLSKAGLSVEYHGRFGNGRIESWLNNAKHLELGQMSDSHISMGSVWPNEWFTHLRGVCMLNACLVSFSTRIIRVSTSVLFASCTRITPFFWQAFIRIFLCLQ